MAQAPYFGHATWSASKGLAVTGADRDYAPAEGSDYVPSAYSAQPGAAARANGYPRQG